MARTLLYNGKIYVARGDFRQAVMIEDGVITAVGGNEELRSMADSATQCRDLEGRTVIPGLNDTHMHLMQFAQARNQAQIMGATSIDEIVDICRRFAEEHPDRVENGLLAGGWNQDCFTDSQRLPDRHDLDRISSTKPVMLIRACYHISAVNTVLLNMLNVTEDPRFTPTDYGVDENGEPNGILYENGSNTAQNIMAGLTAEGMRQDVLDAMDYCVSRGLTSIQSNDAGSNVMSRQEIFDFFHQIYDSGLGKIRYRHQVCFDSPEEFQDSLENGEYAHRNQLYPKGSLLTLGPLKLFKDGSLGARTALMTDGYVGDRDNHGLEGISCQEMDRFCQLAGEHGVQVATHAIGDEAVRRAIRSFSAGFRDSHNSLRHAVVHCQITDQSILDQLAADDILVYAQPIFLNYDMHIADKLVGSELASTSYAWNTLQQQGVHVSYGTDCPIEDCNPFPNIYMAVTRKDLEGRPEGGYYSQECVDVETAIDAYTLESAYAEFMENEKGRIQPGYLADLVVLDRDIFTVNPDEIKDILPVMTMVDGNVVYEA